MPVKHTRFWIIRHTCDECNEVDETVDDTGKCYKCRNKFRLGRSTLGDHRGQDISAVVVGVFADQVHTPGRLCGDDRRRDEDVREVLHVSPASLGGRS